MRTTFFARLLAAAAENPHIVLITADLGFGVVEPFIATIGTGSVMVGMSQLLANGTTISNNIFGPSDTIASKIAGNEKMSSITRMKIMSIGSPM